MVGLTVMVEQGDWGRGEDMLHAYVRSEKEGRRGGMRCCWERVPASR